MQRIVVTGATSMIGCALVEECLKKEVEIYAVIRPGSSNRDRLVEHERLHIIECPIEELEKLPDMIPEVCDTFYHIAWGYTGANRNKSVELQSLNVGYTLTAVRAAHAIGAKRFIGAGSQAEYGVLDLPQISWDSPTNPHTPYGIAKYAAGKMAIMLCKELEMECIWPRIFSVYGIHDKKTSMIMSSLIKMLEGEACTFTPAEQRWEYLYSKDAGYAFYLIGETGKAGSIYCIGSGQARPLKEYIYEMRDAVDPSIEPGIGARPYPVGAVMNLCADISNLQKDTGFAPKYEFAAGIRETIEWLRRNK